MGDKNVVLVVEDEKDLADLYTRWLSDEYDVRTAYDGEEAVEVIDDEVDVVLLDRRLPGMSGDDFLTGIRDKGYDCSVAMVSAVEPDFDIVEMGFDDYVVKPVGKDELLDVVSRLVTLEGSTADTREYFSLISKKKALEDEKTESKLEASDEYAEVSKSVDEFRKYIVALAEDCLAKSAEDTGFGVESVYREALREWRERKKKLDEEDPLYEAARENIRKYEELLAGTGRDDTAERELLRTVADGFVAEGIWLDEAVLRALNYVFYNKFGDTFIIEREPLTEDTELESGKLYEVSEAVRERARDELEERGVNVRR